MYRDRILPLRRDVLARTLAEYNQMLVGTFEVLRAKEMVVEAERGLIDSVALYWEARIALARTTGGEAVTATGLPEQNANDQLDEAHPKHHHGSDPPHDTGGDR